MYHGSPTPLNEITDDGMFGGVFAAPELSSARAHGDYVYAIESPKHCGQNDLLTDMTIGEGWSVACDVVRDWAEARGLDVETVADALTDADTPVPAELGDDPELIGDAGWELQRLRGEIARRLGYTSIDMLDEHGGTTLCLPGCRLSSAR